MFKGELKGYGRIIDATGECRVGFWKDNLPHGKFCHFLKNGKNKIPQGGYIGT